MSHLSLSDARQLENMYYTDTRINPIPDYIKKNRDSSSQSNPNPNLNDSSASEADTDTDSNSEQRSVNNRELDNYVNEPRGNIDINLHLEDQHASENAKYVKNIIYGGLDGIITTFSIIAASVGAGLKMKIIIALGIANLIADGISMGVGEYLSTTFENKYIMSEKSKEEHEYEHNYNYEVEEMVELYKNEGLDEIDAKKIVDIYTSNDKYKPLFIKNMMSMELGLELSDDDPKINGLVTFIAFLIFGFVPIFFYIVFYYADYDEYTNIFIINCFITIITIFTLGIVQAKITKQPLIMSALKLTFNGVLASGLAFLIGWGIEAGLT